MDLFFNRERASGAGPEVDAPSVLVPAPKVVPSVVVPVVAAGAALDAVGFDVLPPKENVGAVDGADDAALVVAVFPPKALPKRPPESAAGAVVVGAEDVPAEDAAADIPPKENAGAALVAGFVPKRLDGVLAGSVVVFTPEPNSDGAVAEVVEEAGFDVVPAGVVRENPGPAGVEEGVEVPPIAPKRFFGAAESAVFGAPNKVEVAVCVAAAGVVECDV